MNNNDRQKANLFAYNSKTRSNCPASSIAPDWGLPATVGKFPWVRNSNIPVHPTLPEIGTPDIGFPTDPNIPVYPTLPEIGTPDIGFPTDPNIPVYPTLPEIGTPDIGFPTNPDIPVYPILPEIGIPDTGFPTFPIFPGNNTDRYCHVRFLHAASGYPALNIIISSYTALNHLQYAQASDYFGVLDGFRTIIIVRTNAPRTVLLRKTIPFKRGDIETMAIINSKDGLDIICISDTTCESMDRYTSYFRVANLSYGSAPLDTMLSDGNMVYNDTIFREVTVFKRLKSGYYQFYVIENMDVPMPIFSDFEIIQPVTHNNMSQLKAPELLLSYDLVVQTKQMSTAYYIGGDTRSNPMQVVILN